MNKKKNSCFIHTHSSFLRRGQCLLLADSVNRDYVIFVYASSILCKFHSSTFTEISIIRFMCVSVCAACEVCCCFESEIARVMNVRLKKKNIIKLRRTVTTTFQKPFFFIHSLYSVSIATNS